MKKYLSRIIIGLFLLIGILPIFPSLAALRQSTNYQIQTDVTDQGGTSSSSSSYKMKPDASGQGAIGETGSTSFSAEAGFIYASEATGEVLVTLFTPNGGEVWEAGTTHNITWETTGSATSINLYYSIDGGSSYTTIVTGEADDGVYEWLVPNDPTTEAKVKIEAIGSIATDESDAVFTIIGTTNFYVDVVNGSNSYNGLTSEVSGMSGPWKNITYAATQAAVGSTINVAYGTYNAAEGEIFPITCEAYLKSIASPTTLATVDAASAAADIFIMRDYGSIEGFTLNSSNSGDYYAIKLANSAEAHNNTITSAGNGIYFDSFNTVISGNTISLSSASKIGIYCYAVNDPENATIDNNTITCNGNSSYGIHSNYNQWYDRLRYSWIKNNNITMHGTGSYGLYFGAFDYTTVEANTIIFEDTATNSNGFYTGGYRCLDNVLKNNVIRAMGSGDFAEGLRYCGPGEFSYNEISGRFQYGMRLASQYTGHTQNHSNNTVVGYRQYGIYTQSNFTGSGSIFANIKNCVVSTREGTSADYGIYEASGTVNPTYNNVFGNTTNYYNCSPDSGSRSHYSQFVDPANEDYHLRYNSPCIDSGNPADTDPDGSRRDMGAYYYDLTVSGTVTVYVIQPNYDSALTGGSIYEISWYATKEGTPFDHVDIAYSLNGGSTYIDIATNEANDGSYLWAVPDVSSAQAKVRVGAFGSVSATDESDGLFTIIASSADYYVDVVNGDNGYSGITSEVSGMNGPWKNISYAADHAPSGSTIHVLAGVYNEGAGEVFPIAPSSEVYLRSIASPTTNATIETVSARAVTLNSENTIEGFTINTATGSTSDGALYLVGRAEVLSNIITCSASSARAIYIPNVNTANGIKIKNNNIWAGNISTVGINLYSGNDNLLIEGNSIEVSSGSGIYLNYNFSNYVICNNTIVGSGGANGIFGGRLYTGDICSNEARGFTTGLFLRGYGTGYEIRAYNNTLVNNTNGIGCSLYSTAPLFTLKNNIICASPLLGTFTELSAGTKGIVQSSGTVNSSYNNIWNVNFKYSGTVGGKTGDISVYPRFISPEANNYRIGTDSPCATAGEGGTYMGRYAPSGTSDILSESWVDDDGSDSNPGTVASPWKTLAKGVSKTEGIIHVKAGTYDTGNGETFPMALAENQYLKSESSPTTNATIESNNARAISLGLNTTVEGFTIRSTVSNSSQGVLYLLGAAGNILSNNIICNVTNARGVFTYQLGDNSLIKDNDIQTLGSSARGIFIYSDCDNITVISNTVEVGSTSHGIYIQYNLLNYELSKNTIKNSGNGTGYGIYGGRLENGDISYNEVIGFTNSSYSGMYISGRDSSANINIHNNTLAKNLVGIICTRYASGSIPVFNVKNNIVWADVFSGSKGIDRNAGTVTSSYNCLFNIETTYEGVVEGLTEDFFRDPQFIDDVTDNYHLKYYSPCIDSGDPSDTDPDGTRVDRGAHYFDLSVPDAVAVYVLEPNGSEFFNGLATTEITWYAAREGGTPLTIDLAYSLNGGSTYTDIATNEPNDGSYIWSIPNVDTTQARIRIGAFGSAATDESDSNFIIQSSIYVNILAPDGGEFWVEGTTQNISWESLGSIEAIDIYYSVNSGATYTTIATGETDDGTYPWLVPNEPTSEARVKIVGTKGALISTDESTTVFTIDAAVISVSLRDFSDTTDYSTWEVGIGDEDTIYIMTSGEAVLVKNDGNVHQDFSIAGSPTNWTLSATGETGTDICVLMGLFNASTAPSAGNFSLVNDIIGTTESWATESGGAGKFEGVESGENVAAGAGRKLYIYFKTPVSISVNYDESLQITIGARRH